MSEVSLEQAVISTVILLGETKPTKVLDMDRLVKTKGVLEIGFRDCNIAVTAIRCVFRQHNVDNRAGDEPDCHEDSHGY